MKEKEMAEDFKTVAEKKQQAEKIERKLSLVEQSLDQDRIRAIELGAPGEISGIPKFDSMLQVMEFAKLMAVADSAVPPHLRGNPGACLAITIRALELRMSPFTVANWSYEVDQGGVKRIAYEAQYYNAIILARAPTKDRPHFEILGEGDERRCKVWATLKGETEPRVFISDTLAKLRPGRNESGVVKGSPLWVKKPDVQLCYNAIRDFARIYFPDVTAGLYTPDELEDDLGESARIVSPPDSTLMGRLTPRASGEGFNHTASPNKIAEAINAARANDEDGPWTSPSTIGPQDYRTDGTAHRDVENRGAEESAKKNKKHGGATTITETATTTEVAADDTAQKESPTAK
jgi:RecT family